MVSVGGGVDTDDVFALSRAAKQNCHCQWEHQELERFVDRQCLVGPSSVSLVQYLLDYGHRHPHLQVAVQTHSSPPESVLYQKKIIENNKIKH